jgi:hypothetical protein
MCMYKGLRCYTACVTETLLQSSKHINVWMTSTRITRRIFPCTSNISTIAGSEGEEHVTVFFMCTFLDRSATAESYCALHVLITRDNALHGMRSVSARSKATCLPKMERLRTYVV